MGRRGRGEFDLCDVGGNGGIQVGNHLLAGISRRSLLPRQHLPQAHRGASVQSARLERPVLPIEFKPKHSR